jgi:hypothetical protein
MDKINSEAEPTFQFPHMEHPDPKIRDYLRERLEERPCPHCGEIKIKGCSTSCCAGYEDTMTYHLPKPMPEHIRGAMESGTLLSDLNFPRRLNKELRPVIQNANISSPRGPASSIFITSIPYAVDTYRQFLTPVYAICNAMN